MGAVPSSTPRRREPLMPPISVGTTQSIRFKPLRIIRKISATRRRLSPTPRRKPGSRTASTVRVFLIQIFAGATISWQLMPASPSPVRLHAPRPSEGALMRRHDVGRGAAPAGRSTQGLHPGGTGAPPGPITRSCQELTDDRKVHTKRAGAKPQGSSGPARATCGESAARCPQVVANEHALLGAGAWRIFLMRYRFAT